MTWPPLGLLCHSPQAAGVDQLTGLPPPACWPGPSLCQRKKQEHLVGINTVLVNK